MIVLTLNRQFVTAGRAASATLSSNIADAIETVRAIEEPHMGVNPVRKLVIVDSHSTLVLPFFFSIP